MALLSCRVLLSSFPRLRLANLQLLDFILDSIRDVFAIREVDNGTTWDALTGHFISIRSEKSRSCYQYYFFGDMHTSDRLFHARPSLELPRDTISLVG